MDTQKKPPIWATILWNLLWALVLAGMVYDYTMYHTINPLGVILLSILVLGTLISLLRKQPLLSTRGWFARTMFAAVLLVLTVGYILVRIFVFY